MSDPQENPWSDNPNAPKIPYALHLDEKANFAGYLVASILYGTSRTPHPHALIYLCPPRLFGSL